MSGDGDRAPVTLRGHHLGCVQAFRGFGYDPSFTANIAALAARLQADPTHPVRVAGAPDDVCGPCPHLSGTSCVRTPKAQRAVEAHDRAFLMALDLAPGDLTSLAAVNARLAADPDARARIREACNRCPWNGGCPFYDRL